MSARGRRRHIAAVFEGTKAMKKTQPKRLSPPKGRDEERVARLAAANAGLQAEIEQRLGTASDDRSELRWLKALINQVPDYLFVKDTESRFVVANRAVARDVGRSEPEALIGKTDLDIHPPEVAHEFYDIDQHVVKTGEAMIDIEEFVVLPTGDKRWLSTSKVPLRDSTGKIIGLVGVARDITERKLADLLLAEQADLLEMIARNAPLEDVLNSLMVLIESRVDDIMGSILLLSEDGKHLRRGAAPTLPEAWTSAIDGVAIGPSVGSCGTAAYRKETVIVSDIMTDPLWADYVELAAPFGFRSCWSTPVMSHRGFVLGTFAMYSHKVREPGPLEMRMVEMGIRIAAIAIERKRAEDRIHFMAHHDVLTGLPNRTLLGDRLEQAILHAKRYNRSVTVVFLDLDNFKIVNDSLGHVAGDELLQIVANRMVDCIRITDTAVRLGGDEFVILLGDLPQNDESTTTLIQKIQATIAEPVMIGGREFRVTCSIGVATYPNDGADAEQLLANADAAMYRAKESGRDNFQFYTAEMNLRVHERLMQQEELRQAISRQEFELHYQPQLDLRTGKIFAVEALVRWRHPTKGLVSPANFIPLAEETALIVPIGDWVLRTACQQNRKWQEAGMPPVTMCVNVSARQFRERNLVERVAFALKESGLEAKYLELELTESLIMQDLTQAISTMRELEDLGVHLSIDDFGTGYSSLSALKSFPVARLKIDQSFVRGLPNDENDKAITTAVISLGQRLNLRVIAEGVETTQQMDFLRENGCDEMQGYHFSKPLDSEGLEKLLRRHA
jgi:diguanylate cyclase (GGDEF)-like protein/PAS domain S-box-containing protein